MNRNFKGVWIPKEIWLNTDLTWMEKLFVTEVSSLDNENGCFATNAYFADFFNMSKQWCSNIVTSLKNKGFITVDYVYEGKEIKKRIMNVVQEKIMGGIQDSVGGYTEKQKGNNTLINNTYHTTYDITTSKDVDNNTLNMFPEIKDQPTVKKEVFSHELVEYWNKQPHLRTHKNNTKTYAKALSLFEQIKQGVFGQNNNISDKYLKFNKIDIGRLHQKASIEDIKQAIDRFNILCDPDCPSFKTGYPKSCDQFLYNNSTHSSFFYSLFGPDKEPVAIKAIPIDIGLVRFYQDELIKNRKLNNIEYNELVKGVNFVITMFKEFQEKIYPIPIPRIFSGKSAYRIHISFLRQRYLDTGVFTLAHILNKNIWKKFIDWVGQVHRVDLYPEGVSLEARKAKYIESQKDAYNGVETNVMSQHAS